MSLSALGRSRQEFFRALGSDAARPRPGQGDGSESSCLKLGSIARPSNAGALLVRATHPYRSTVSDEGPATLAAHLNAGADRHSAAARFSSSASRVCAFGLGCIQLVLFFLAADDRIFRICWTRYDSLIGFWQLFASLFGCDH